MVTNQTRSGIARPIDEKSDGLLRLVLKLDAVATGAVGLLLLAADPALDGLLGLPISLLMPVKLFLIGYAAAIWVVATRPRVSRPAAWTAIAINLVYTVDTIVVEVSGWFALTVLGTAFVLLQAAAVALFAAAQFYALRRSV
jgi:hypothetical protein